MNSFEINKIVGAVLFTTLVIIGLKSFSEVLYHTEKPEKLGYPVKVAAVEPGKGAHPTPAPVKKVSLASLLSNASVERGQAVSKKCAACHSFQSGGPNKIGPNLYGIVARVMGAAPGFSYSTAVKAKAAEGKTWTFEALNSFFQGPKKFLPGTKMAFAGIRKPKDRANLIVFLRSLNATPVALPVVKAPPMDPPSKVEKPKAQMMDGADKVKAVVKDTSEKANDAAKNMMDKVKAMPEKMAPAAPEAPATTPDNH